jgi:hypothetical protein
MGQMYGRAVFGLLQRLTFSRGFTDVTWWVGYLTTLYVLNVTNLIDLIVDMAVLHTYS